MPEITIHLMDHIYERLVREAVRVGLDSGEFARVLIGSNIPDHELEPDPSISSVPHDFVQMATRAGMAMAAALGDLTCRHCTQKITTDAVTEGHCQNCQGDL